jgi:hypothetical protein
VPDLNKLYSMTRKYYLTKQPAAVTDRGVENEINLN